MWKLWGTCGLLLALLGVFAGVSRSDNVDVDDRGPDSTFPLPPSEQGPLGAAPPGTRAPQPQFRLYEAGPPESVWRYEQVTPDEREVIDLGRDVSGWSAGQDAMVEAVHAQAVIEAAMLAQRRLGLGDFGEIGVVP